MYNKLFTKILDSSIWLEQSPTRIVWMTLIAAMDESGFAQFASVANLAHRARVTLDEGNAAVTVLESPDVNSADPEHEGRRIERVPGGWMVLNAEKYRDLVTRATIQEQTRLRVAKHRAKKKGSNAGVTEGNEKLTPSESESESEKREREAGDWPSKIMELYPRRDSPMDSMQAISDSIKSGESGEVIANAVRECARLIVLAPGGSGNRYVPSARAFFTGQQWRSPEKFKGLQENGSNTNGHKPVKPVKRDRQ